MSKSIFPETLTVRFRATWAAVSVYSPCTPMIRVQILPKSTIFLLKLLLNRTKINKKKTGLALNIQSTSINISGVNAKSLEIWNLRTNENAYGGSASQHWEQVRIAQSTGTNTLKTVFAVIGLDEKLGVRMSILHQSNQIWKNFIAWAIFCRDQFGFAKY